MTDIETFHLTAMVAMGDMTMAEALACADRVSDLLSDIMVPHEPTVVVTSNDVGQIDPPGVFCDGCVGNTVSGVRWPAIVDGDASRSWVERCDTCQRFSNDEAAAQAVADKYGDIAVARVHFDKIPSLSGLQPYIAGEIA